MCTSSEESFHYDYIRLAWDVGFTFEDHAAHQKLDLNVIGLVDVDQVAKDRDIPTVVKHIPTLLSFRLENDIGRVLEPNFIKLFKLAQLSIQYLKFCKTYLDNTVALLKYELQTMGEEKKELQFALDEVHQDNDSRTRKYTEIQTSQSTSAYKCDECPKTFYSEEYLFAHVKRRHEPVVSRLQNESDKLQTEIKELKQRLNNTEKLISEKESEKEQEHIEPNNDAAVFEQSIQYKFQQLKSHIETEINSLKNEDFYKGICEKFMQERSFKRLSIHTLQSPAVNITGSSKIDKATQDDMLGAFKSENCTDSSTQTEFGKNYVSEGTSTSPKWSPLRSEKQMERKDADVKDRDEKTAITMKRIEDKLVQEVEMQRTSLEQILDSKLSGSLNKMEAQMHAFWEKINTWESVVAKPKVSTLVSDNQHEEGGANSVNSGQGHLRKSDSHCSPLKRTNPMNVSLESSKKIAPKPLPRQLTRKVDSGVRSPITVVPKRRNDSHLEKENLTISNQLAAFLSDSSSDTETEETEKSSENSILRSDDTDDRPSNIKPSASFKQRLDEALMQRLKGVNHKNPSVRIPSPTALKEAKPEETPVVQVHYRRETQLVDSDSVTDDKSLALSNSSVSDDLQQIQDMKQRLKRHVEKSMNDKLKQIGVSPNWKGLPEKSYKKALDIVEHQASLTKKNIIDYHKIRKQIERSLEQSAKESRALNNAKNIVPTTSAQESPEKNLRRSFDSGPDNYEFNDRTKFVTTKPLTKSSAEDDVPQDSSTSSQKLPMKYTKTSSKDIQSTSSPYNTQNQSKHLTIPDVVVPPGTTNLNHLPTGQIPLELNYANANRKKVIFNLDSDSLNQKQKVETNNDKNELASYTKSNKMKLQANIWNPPVKSSTNQAKSASDSDWDISEIT